MKSLYRTSLIFALAIVALSDGVRAEKVYDTQERERYWSIFTRTKTDSPSAELELARSLEDEGRDRAARRRYSAIVKYWPTAPEAAKAQYAKARILDELGKEKAAFDAYQELFDNYPASFPPEKVLERQFDIAVEVMNARKMRFLFGGLSDPEAAVPLFEKIVANAPEWERAPNAQYLIGEAYGRAKRFELAVPEYQAVELRYAGHPLAAQAAFKKCQLLFKLSERHENDGRLRRKAYSELALFVAKYPESQFHEQALKMKQTQYEKEAAASFQIAEYYETTARRPEAALTEYRRLLREYPNSKWTDKAEERIKALEHQSEVKDE
jgi:outer membrane protein assembly factor BamD (BamD/ComL family)